MQLIKNIFCLYLFDWKWIFKNLIVIFLIIVIMIIFLLYVWFNIKVLWDLYGNIGELLIVVYSVDKLVEF